MNGRRHGREDPQQLHIDWSGDHDTDTVAPAAPSTPSPAPSAPGTPAAERPAAGTPALIQPLPWDFRTSFPQPTPEAIDAGIVSEEDTDPENLQALHGEYAREALSVLRDLDAVLDARRRGLDPRTGKPPRTDASREQVRKLLESETDRLPRWWRTLLETYESAFGADAADAFGKALRAWHAGIEVIGQSPSAGPGTVVMGTGVTGTGVSRAEIRAPTGATAEPTMPAAKPMALTQAVKDSPRNHPRVVARLPVPKPLPEAIAAGRFGRDERGPIRPCAAEVRAITGNHAEKLIELLKPDDGTDRVLAQTEFDAGIAAYAEDFGEDAARRLEAYVRRQVSLGDGPPRRSGRSR